MSAPRRIVPGTTYLLTRRCSERRFLLRPGSRINRIFKFCLAAAAERSGVLLHGYVAMSNHYHVVVTDVHGHLPIFMHWLNEYVAKCINVELGRWESFWAPGSYSQVELVDCDDVVDKLVYVFVNPVAAGLVRTHTEWPGARSLVSDIDGTEEVVPRPDGFFQDNGVVPETATLRMVSPPAFERHRPDYLAVLRKRVTERELELQQQMRRSGGHFLGARKVLAQSAFSRPRTHEPRRGLDPRVASRDKWRRIEALQRLRDFLVAYRTAFLRFVEGERGTLFPFGTYGMRVRFGVPCAGP